MCSVCVIADVSNGVEGIVWRWEKSRWGGSWLRCASVCEAYDSRDYKHVCVWLLSDLSPLALSLHGPSRLHRTHANTHTPLNPVRKSSQGPWGRQEKAPQRLSPFHSLISPSLDLFPPLSSTPSLPNPHLHIHRQRGSLRGLLSEMGRRYLLFVALQMEKSHFLFLSSMEVYQRAHVCVCACTSARRAGVWMESCVVRQFHSLIGWEPGQLLGG